MPKVIVIERDEPKLKEVMIKLHSIGIGFRLETLITVPKVRTISKSEPSPDIVEVTNLRNKIARLEARLVAAVHGNDKLERSNALEEKYRAGLIARAETAEADARALRDTINDMRRNTATDLRRKLTHTHKDMIFGYWLQGVTITNIHRLFPHVSRQYISVVVADFKDQQARFERNYYAKHRDNTYYPVNPPVFDDEEALNDPTFPPNELFLDF